MRRRELLNNEKTVMIWKSPADKGLWGYVVDPSEIHYLFETDMLAVQSDLSIKELKNKMKEGGFSSFNSFMIEAVKKGTVTLLEPAFSNTIIGSFLFSQVPRYLWSIDQDKLISAKGFEKVPYYVYTSDGQMRFVCAADCMRNFCTYNPGSETVDGDITWYDSIKNQKLVLKNFNGITLANILPDADFKKFIEQTKN